MADSDWCPSRIDSVRTVRVELVVMLFRGIDLPNCGRYGVFFPQPLRWYSPLEDMILVWHELCFMAVRKKDRVAVDTYF